MSVLKKREYDYEELSSVYRNDWYTNQVIKSVESARIFVDAAWQYVQPRSVLDVGCGRGGWLKAWHDKGADFVVGFDGAWNKQSNMIDSSIEFKAMDLNRAFDVPHKFDLVMSLEVAEHLRPESSNTFVECLASASDVVLFAAAFVGQGGNNHINEQRHTYWAQLFAEHDFLPFDVFRSVLWADDRICFWYRQNTFLYAKKHTIAYERLISQGVTPMDNIAFMDAVHPSLYAEKVRQMEFKHHLTDLVPSFVRELKSYGRSLFRR